MSAWLLQRLSALTLRWIVSSLLAAGLFWAGYRQGQQGVQQAWGTERLQRQTAALQQSLEVAQVQNRQEQINQRITTDHDTRKTQLQRLWQPQQKSSSPVFLSSVPVGEFTVSDSLCQPTCSSDSPCPVPFDAQLATGVDAAASHPIPDPARTQIPVSCEQPASDAAQATLMVLSFQRWYAEQVKVKVKEAPP